MTRTVTLVLVEPDGTVLGQAEPFEADVPWWQEVGGFGRDVQVLRLLGADLPAPPGGHVTYLAEVTGGFPGQINPTSPYEVGPHPLRAAYAEVGGPAASIEWATALAPGTTAQQKRTWNLSAIWRLDDKDGHPVAWLKQVPRFFAHEAYALRMVAAVAPHLVPELIADGEHGRMLLAHAPGEDRYGAGPELCAEIAAAFHPIQAHFAADPALLAGIPDARLEVAPFARVAEPHYATIPGLQRLIDDLPARFAAIAECGLPDTLVHGDLHPGNARTDDQGRLTIMDWGDCTYGNPVFDILRLTDGRTGGFAPHDETLAAWADRWKQTVPGCDPLRAAELMRPVAPLRSALIYATFLENIEPSEWPYHAADVPERLAAAVAETIP
ncbi:aminoglycoside phosphotransferase family protein [Paractinoplanes lichenicola]|uniref:Aminoglycoside phosphotransferase family protein n=1 Tax=Paractinoplanes lichenicola TaxID=2802976 RepID=A0ABS1W5B9_9ACTN|nr:aminoglycoside phosphotransferase family protein [Actinoplanes lichenicola]MBL7261910.1 aminoglycoside phosphotransferase family protein [Actinoplanes lichenicola]